MLNLKEVRVRDKKGYRLFKESIYKMLNNSDIIVLHIEFTSMFGFKTVAQFKSGNSHYNYKCYNLNNAIKLFYSEALQGLSENVILNLIKCSYKANGEYVEEFKDCSSVRIFNVRSE